MKRYLLLAALVLAFISLKAQTPDTVKIDNRVYATVEKLPTYPDGMSAFYYYISTALHYPAIDQKNHVQGRVFVSFIVERDGTLSTIKVLRAPSETLGKEGARIISQSPKWIPGMQGGKTVRVQFTLPINFALKD
ncbi:energy transducer TonB [Mucilaginibacter sp. HMF5004]|uniref:energy transducer TonB n=1 Tax=Mucilaginibacter rivuli TaxID=2857527 RepID=UPI001C5DB901|nr:energy transducer TonB [Mucilaginibacter rivuli]MBW4891888.1 energy transducer TonB [Mucilaginibacter rivuli]